MRASQITKIEKIAITCIRILVETIRSSLTAITIEQLYPVIVEISRRSECEYKFVPKKRGDYRFMELMQDLSQNRLLLIVETDLHKKKIPLDVSKWKKLDIKSKFMIYRGKPNYAAGEIDLESQPGLRLKIHTTYFITPLDDMSTLRREETAFSSLKSLHLKEHLLRGKEPEYISCLLYTSDAADE